MSQPTRSDPAARDEPPPRGPREVRVRLSGANYRVEANSARHQWVLDESSEDGGTDTGPTPVEAFLGALLSCLSISFQYHARRNSVPIERIEGWVAANQRRYLREISIELEVWSPAAEEAVRELLPAAERGCFVKEVLKAEVSYAVDLVVHPAAEASSPSQS